MVIAKTLNLLKQKRQIPLLPYFSYIVSTNNVKNNLVYFFLLLNPVLNKKFVTVQRKKKTNGKFSHALMILKVKKN